MANSPFRLVFATLWISLAIFAPPAQADIPVSTSIAAAPTQVVGNSIFPCAAFTISFSTARLELLANPTLTPEERTLISQCSAKDLANGGTDFLLRVLENRSNYVIARHHLHGTSRPFQAGDEVIKAARFDPAAGLVYLVLDPDLVHTDDHYDVYFVSLSSSDVTSNQVTSGTLAVQSAPDSKPTSGYFMASNLVSPFGQILSSPSYTLVSSPTFWDRAARTNEVVNQVGFTLSTSDVYRSLVQSGNFDFLLAKGFRYYSYATPTNATIDFARYETASSIPLQWQFDANTSHGVRGPNVPIGIGLEFNQDFSNIFPSASVGLAVPLCQPSMSQNSYALGDITGNPKVMLDIEASGPARSYGEVTSSANFTHDGMVRLHGSIASSQIPLDQLGRVHDFSSLNSATKACKFYLDIRGDAWLCQKEISYEQPYSTGTAYPNKRVEYFGKVGLGFSISDSSSLEISYSGGAINWSPFARQAGLSISVNMSS